MTPEAVNLYLKANGITVQGSTDNYYRLSSDGIKEWTNNAPQPTESDLKTYEDQIKAAEQAVAYKNKRAQEYPPIGDQLDALYKAGVFPADMAAKIKAVKDKYPKL